MVMILLLHSPFLPNRSLCRVQVLVTDITCHPSFLITLYSWNAASSGVKYGPPLAMLKTTVKAHEGGPAFPDKAAKSSKSETRKMFWVWNWQPASVTFLSDCLLLSGIPRGLDWNLRCLSSQGEFKGIWTTVKEMLPQTLLSRLGSYKEQSDVLCLEWCFVQGIEATSGDGLLSDRVPKAA